MRLHEFAINETTSAGGIAGATPVLGIGTVTAPTVDGKPRKKPKKKKTKSKPEIIRR